MTFALRLLVVAGINYHALHGAIEMLYIGA